MTDDWDAIRAWRSETRKDLIARREALPEQEKLRRGRAIIAALEQLASNLTDRTVGFYWPLGGEVDLVPFMRSKFGMFQAAALPVVVAKEKPLEFWRWSPQTELRPRGSWKIPAPVDRVLVTPDVLFAPLVGFDEAGFRLGYGSGYFDRTLATVPDALVIGVGYELTRLATIRPQPHDVPMSFIVTERGVWQRPAEQRSSKGSSARGA